LSKNIKNKCPRKRGKKTLRKTAIFSTKKEKKSKTNKTAWNSQNLIEFFAWNVQTI
jgi:hypothetical protein